MPKRLTEKQVNKFIEGLLELGVPSDKLLEEVETFLSGFPPPKTKIKKVKVRRGIGSY